MEFEWSVVNLERRASDNYVQVCHWTCTATDGDFSANAYGSVGFSGDLVTPYENLTQEQVLRWVWEQIDKAEIEANLTKQIETQKNPVSATGLPWANNGE